MLFLWRTVYELKEQIELLQVWSTCQRGFTFFQEDLERTSNSVVNMSLWDSNVLIRGTLTKDKGALLQRLVIGSSPVCSTFIFYLILFLCCLDRIYNQIGPKTEFHFQREDVKTKCLLFCIIWWNGENMVSPSRLKVYKLWLYITGKTFLFLDENCLGDQLSCDTKCVAAEHICDGKLHCHDATDEMYCGKLHVHPAQFAPTDKPLINWLGEAPWRLAVYATHVCIILSWCKLWERKSHQIILVPNVGFKMKYRMPPNIHYSHASPLFPSCQWLVPYSYN